MSEPIDRAIAEKVLLAAFRTRCLKVDDISKQIRRVLNGTHKTYKYILVNGLLAKATNNKVNPICLQAGANHEGAFDARSLCHNVLVPFERDFLKNALGGSNEPFLNKPARFTHLSTDNAVRKGKDRETLETVISIFNAINDSSKARIYLSCALECLTDRIRKLNLLHDTNVNYNPTLVEIYEFIYLFLEKSFEGEKSVLIVSTLEKIYYKRFSQKFEVKVHKVNQSGASSKEIGDIDVYKDTQFMYAIEVKDKAFSSYDLDHAFRKMRQNGGKRGEFIFGPNATFNDKEIRKKLQEYDELGFYTLF